MVYRGRIDFSSLASRVSKLSSMANQVNEKLYSYMTFAWRFGTFSVGFAPATEGSHCKGGHAFHVHICISISAVIVTVVGRIAPMMTTTKVPFFTLSLPLSRLMIMSFFLF